MQKSAKNVTQEQIAEQRKAVVEECNKLAEQEASVKEYIVKRYGCEKLV